MSRRWGYANGAALRLKRCTLRSPEDAFRFVVLPKLSGEEAFASEDWTSKAIQVNASDNVIASDGVFAFSQQEVKALLPPGEAENLLVRMVGWRGERNAYACERTLLRLKRHRPEAKLPPPLIADGLTGWRQLWGTAEEGSLEGPIRFVGGDLLAKAEAALDQLTPGDFRLRADSAGYRAGPDGKDLGADVHLVGPGAAYERWKQTPQYQEWLAVTGQKAE